MPRINSSSIISFVLFFGLIAILISALSAEENKSKLATLSITGISEDIRDNVMAYLPAFVPECQSRRDEVELFLNASLPKIRSAMRALGYYSPKITLKTEKNEHCWELNYAINPGEIVTVIQQEIVVTGQGKSDLVFHYITLTPPYKPGEAFRHDKYESYKTRFTNHASRKGYFDSQFITREVIVDTDRNTAQIKLHFETGERYRFGRVSIEQPVLSEQAVAKYIDIKEGEYYSSDVLTKQQQLLQGTGYYAAASVAADYRGADDKQIPVDIKMTALKQKVYEARIGYGTDTGFRVGLDHTRRWTGKKGAKLEITSGISQVKQFAKIGYTVPSLRRRDTFMRYSLGWTQEQGEDIRSKSLELGAEYSRLLSSKWKHATSISYLDDTTRVPGQTDIRTNFLIFATSLERSKADNRLFTRKGWGVKAGLKGAHDGLLSSSSFMQASLYAKLIYPAGKGRVITRGQVGATLTDQFDLLPQSLRFFAGGDNSVRGYSYESLGEINSVGAVIGGKHLFTASVEYEHPIKDDWSLALFIDTGNAFNDWDTMNLKTGAGFGARWKSPIGPVRVDIAWPVDKFSDPHIHLSIGPDL